MTPIRNLYEKNQMTQVLGNDRVIDFTYNTFNITVLYGTKFTFINLELI